MCNRPKKPGVMFWASILLVALAAYPLSFGPACRLARYQWMDSFFETAYGPCIAGAIDGPTAIKVPLRWWVKQCGGERVLIGLEFARMPGGHLSMEWTGEPEPLHFGDDTSSEDDDRSPKPAGPPEMDPFPQEIRI